MTTNDLLQALARLRVETGSLACLGCGHEHNCSTHGCAILRAAADLIERLTAESTDLRKEIEWKDMVIALAQKKQTEAEAERDAPLEYAKTMQECEMCKNDTFCHLREPMEDDCKHCQRVSDCPCQKCEENNCWEWRGLPEEPEEGEKA